MKKYRRAFLAAIMILSVLLSGCLGGKIKYPTYYTLNLPAPVDPPPKGSSLPSIAVRDFRAPTYLRQGPRLTSLLTHASCKRAKLGLKKPNGSRMSATGYGTWIQIA
jgi:hypothetical protein